MTCICGHLETEHSGGKCRVVVGKGECPCFRFRPVLQCEEEKFDQECERTMALHQAAPASNRVQ